MKNEIENLVSNYESKKLNRRQLIASLAALTAVSATQNASSQESTNNPPPATIGKSMNHLSLSVSDVNRSADFYHRVLGLDIVSRPGNGGLNMGLGDSFLGLYKFDNPGSMHHLCLGVDDYNPDLLAEKLKLHGIAANINRNPDSRTSGGDQLYFTDPDGILVQLSGDGYQG